MPVTRIAKKLLYRQVLPFFSLFDLEFAQRHTRATLYFILGWVQHILFVLSVLLLFQNHRVIDIALFSGFLASSVIPSSNLQFRSGMIGLQSIYLFAWVLI